jgi:hypothetical protein
MRPAAARSAQQLCTGSAHGTRRDAIATHGTVVTVSTGTVCAQREGEECAACCSSRSSVFGTLARRSATRFRPCNRQGCASASAVNGRATVDSPAAGDVPRLAYSGAPHILQRVGGSDLQAAHLGRAQRGRMGPHLCATASSH